jgi:hypothetical protein
MSPVARRRRRLRRKRRASAAAVSASPSHVKLKTRYHSEPRATRLVGLIFLHGACVGTSLCAYFGSSTSTDTIYEAHHYRPQLRIY